MTDTFSPPEPTVNGTTKRLVCKFEPMTHGTFTSPVVLKQHYVAQHAHEYVDTPNTQRVQCNLCDKEIARAAALYHMRKIHRRPDWQKLIRPAGTPKPTIDVEQTTIEQPTADCRICGHTLHAKNLARHVRGVHGVDDYHAHPAWATPATQAVELIEPVRRRALKNQHKLDADQIVIGTADMLASPHGMIPVDALPALLEWRDATQRFIDRVTGNE